MSARTAVARLTSMDGAELRFRVSVETGKLIDRTRHRVRPAQWDRGALARRLHPSAGPLVVAAIGAAQRRAFDDAHAALRSHFVDRRSVWPIAAQRRTQITRAIESRFPDAASAAAGDALRVLDGRCDVLGYRDVRIGHPPDWHTDPVHRRQAPQRFWADIPYLDPEIGDHKIVWEINRHQHWLTLGRASWLTGDPRFRDGFVAQLTDWIAHNPPLTGINWSSMLELAFRALSWTWAIEFFAEGRATRDERPWLVDLLLALDRQLEHISRNLSLYFSPNTHLTGEALALYAVSLALPELSRSPARIELGRTILLREAGRQILTDGGHAERSPHYHRYSTDFYLLALLVARAAGDGAAPALEQTVRAQAEYLRIVADDRGRLPLLGDDDGGQLFGFGSRPFEAAATLNAAASALHDARLAVGPPEPETLWILGSRPAAGREPRTSGKSAAVWPSGAHLLGASGYFVNRVSGSQLIFDVGTHGFLNGGHAHADALSVVATIEGDPVLVDPGTATYTVDAEMRDTFRSTPMHNALMLDGRDFARAAGPFHWSRVANARVLRRDAVDGVHLVQATHDGYGDRHVRTVVTLPDAGWLVVDHVLAEDGAAAEAWWHLHPSWTPSVHGGRVDLRHRRTGQRSGLAFAGGEIHEVQDPGLCAFSPEYGRIEPAPVLRVTRTETRPFAMATFIPIRHALSSAMVVRPVRVTTEAPPDRLGSVWTLELDGLALDVFVGPAWSQPCIVHKTSEGISRCAG